MLLLAIYHPASLIVVYSPLGVIILGVFKLLLQLSQSRQFQDDSDMQYFYVDAVFGLIVRSVRLRAPVLPRHRVSFPKVGS